MRALPFVILISLAGCADFPQLEAVVSQTARDAPYPVLTPLGPLLAQVEGSGRITAQSELQADQRTDSLRARAAALRGPVVDSATRARMAAAARRAALR